MAIPKGYVYRYSCEYPADDQSTLLYITEELEPLELVYELVSPHSSSHGSEISSSGRFPLRTPG